MTVVGGMKRAGADKGGAGVVLCTLVYCRSGVMSFQALG